MKYGSQQTVKHPKIKITTCKEMQEREKERVKEKERENELNNGVYQNG